MDLSLCVGLKTSEFQLLVAFQFSDFFEVDQMLQLTFMALDSTRFFQHEGHLLRLVVLVETPAAAAAAQGSSTGQQQPDYCTVKAAEVGAVASVCSDTAGNVYAFFTSFFRTSYLT